MSDDENSLLRKMNSSDREDLVLTAMERLIPRCEPRKLLALIWRVWDEKPIEDVAARLGVTPGTVTKWCASATEHLRPIILDLLKVKADG
jgi:DNA-directed RNA polymerase specialized sigma24 family protein